MSIEVVVAIVAAVVVSIVAGNIYRKHKDK